MREFWAVDYTLLFGAFSFIFLAALPGRTTFLMLLMATRSGPWSVFFGASLAFIVQSAISVALGHVISFLPPRVIQFCSGLLLIYFSIHFWRDSKQDLQSESLKLNSKSKSNTIRSSFLIIFMAEWGDVSQVAIASFSARAKDAITVFMSAVSALCFIAALAVFIGSRGSRVFKHPAIQKFAAIGFAFSGAYLLVRAALQ